MTANLSQEYHRRPSASIFMLKAFLPSPGLRAAGGVPPLSARWHNHSIDRSLFPEFLRLTGLGADTCLPLLYPHVFGFPLQMAILTHPEFPVPIWNALQIRNRLVQYQPIAPGSAMEFETRVAGHRILEKGLEVDLATAVHIGSDRVWESSNTFYYRGRFGEPETASPAPLPPQVPSAEVARWRLPSGAGWSFARMTGDYNGIHRWQWYARLFGFRQAFFHPQLIAGQCMARLQSPDPAGPQTLDLWLKGPVYFNSDVRLLSASQEGAAEFALMLEGDGRPAILGRWGSLTPKD